MSTIFLCSEPFANHMIVFYFFGSTCEQNTQLAIPVNNELKQQGDGAGEHLKNDKLRVAGQGLENTRNRFKSYHSSVLSWNRPQYGLSALLASVL